MDKRLAFPLGFLLGATLGWIAGILSAPQSGEETMEAIGDKAIELKEKAEHVVSRAHEEVVARAEEFGAEAQELGTI